jgi:hypothetical protein
VFQLRGYTPRLAERDAVNSYLGNGNFVKFRRTSQLQTFLGTHLMTPFYNNSLADKFGTSPSKTNIKIIIRNVVGTVLQTPSYHILQAIHFVRSPRPLAAAVKFNFSRFLYLIYKLAVQDVPSTGSHSFVFFSPQGSAIFTPVKSFTCCMKLIKRLKFLFNSVALYIRFI